MNAINIVEAPSHSMRFTTSAFLLSHKLCYLSIRRQLDMQPAKETTPRPDLAVYLSPVLSIPHTGYHCLAQIAFAIHWLRSMKTCAWHRHMSKQSRQTFIFCQSSSCHDVCVYTFWLMKLFLSFIRVCLTDNHQIKYFKLSKGERVRTFVSARSTHISRE